MDESRRNFLKTIGGAALGLATVGLTYADGLETRIKTLKQDVNKLESKADTTNVIRWLKQYEEQADEKYKEVNNKETAEIYMKRMSNILEAEFYQPMETTTGKELEGGRRGLMETDDYAAWAKTTVKEIDKIKKLGQKYKIEDKSKIFLDRLVRLGEKNYLYTTPKKEYDREIIQNYDRRFKRK